MARSNFKFKSVPYEAMRRHQHHQPTRLSLRLLNSLL
jgi:hypothetical protein